MQNYSFYINEEKVLSNFFHPDQVFNFFHHSKNLRSSFYFSGSIHLIQSKCFQGEFLTLRPVDTTFYQRNLYLFHYNRVVGYCYTLIKCTAVVIR